MINREEKKKLLLQLVPESLRKHIETIQWLYYGARGSGRTTILCVVALLRVLDGQEIVLVDHAPQNNSNRDYMLHIALKLATSIGLQIKVIKQSGNVRIREHSELDVYEK